MIWALIGIGMPLWKPSGGWGLRYFWPRYLGPCPTQTKMHPPGIAVVRSRSVGPEAATSR